MKIEAKDKKLNKLLSNTQFVIPDYQRPYSWTADDEVAQLWEDIESSYLTNESFFIGPMVLKGVSLESPSFEVIDGQQRLTTITIILSVLKNKFSSYGESSLAEGVKRYMLFKDVNDIEKLVLETEQPHPYFQKKIIHGDSSITPTKEDELNIEGAFLFLTNKIDKLIDSETTTENKLTKIKEIRDKVLDIDTVVMVSDIEGDAYSIFESINTRGKDLESIDLLKNYIFRVFTRMAGVDEPREQWKSVEENIKKERKDFFNRFWSSYFAKKSEYNLYKSFIKNINTAFNDYTEKDLFKNLLESSASYKKIIDPQLTDWSVNNNISIYYSIKALNNFKIKVHYPLLIALFDEYSRGTTSITLLKKYLTVIEQFHFLFSAVVSGRPSGMDKLYSKHAINFRKAINKQDSLDELKKELISKMPSFEIFSEKFKDLTFVKDKYLIKYLYLKLEKNKNAALNIDVDSEKISLEHISSQSSNFINVNKITNLLLLEEVLNNTRQDKDLFTGRMDFEDEKNKSVIDIFISRTRYISSKDKLIALKTKGKWTEEDIDLEIEVFAKKVYDIFKI